MADLSKKLSQLSPEKLELLRRKLEQSKTKQTPVERISPRADHSRYPLSSAQSRLWFLTQMEPDSPFYNIPSAIHIKGLLNLSLIEESLNTIAQRHEILRAWFDTDDKGEPVQQIEPELKIKVEVVPVGRHSAAGQAARLQELLKNEAATAFAIHRFPLLRVKLFRLAENEHILSINMHHLIADGWSMGIFIREFMAIYNALSKGKSVELPEPELQFADYAQWQAERANQQTIQQQLDYWKKYLDAMPLLLELPTDYPRPSIMRHKGRHHHFVIDKSLTEQLRHLSRELNISLYMTIMAAFQLFLHKISGQADFGVGAPIANRHRQELETMIGFFVNTVVLRANFEKDITFLELAKRVSNDVLTASENQEAPFEKIVEMLDPHRELSRSPLFQVMFDLQQAPFEKLNIGDIEISLVDIEIEIAKFDLLMLLLESESGIKGTLEYSTDLFCADTVERFSRYFVTLLRNIAANPDRKISDLSIISEQEKQQILFKWNQTRRPYPNHATLNELFEQQVKKTPLEIAMSFGAQQLTFVELNHRANQMAHYLIKQGAKKDDLVTLYMDRSPEMFIAVLGIIKVGAAYVPLDIAYPKDRLAFMITDTNSTLVLTTEPFKHDLPETAATVICLDHDQKFISLENTDNPANVNTADSRAYIIYTSGSTGKPKGVVVPHRAIIRLVINTDYIELGPGQRIAQVSNASFDAATLEIWGAFLTGATMVGIERDVLLSTGEFVKELQRHKITALFLTTALFNQIALDMPESFQTLTTLMTGGESCNPQAFQAVLQAAPPKHLLHVYGPTENTTFSSWFEVREVPEKAVTLPIGKPIANSILYILDKYLQPAPVGVCGELYVGGDGLAIDYHNRPELTVEKFIPNPFIGDWRLMIDDLSVSNSVQQQSTINNQQSTISNRLYKTGDLVRYLPDGNVEFIGRIDQQVKIRGFRIELPEIEILLKTHPRVKDTTVIARDDLPGGGKQLVAYVVADALPVPDNAELHKYLSEKLPDYMVPSLYVFLDAIPLTPNGKVDRRAMPVPEKQRLSSAAEFVAPRNAVEKFLVDIWREILGLEKISVHDNFFDLGGNSLKAAVFANRIQKEFGEVMHVGAVFKAPRISELATYMTEYYAHLVHQKFGEVDNNNHLHIKIDADGHIEKLNYDKIAQFRSIIHPLPPLTRPNQALLPKNPSAVFVLSPPRSGSTLLRVMLAGNKHLFSPPELDLLSFNTLREQRETFSRDDLRIWLEASLRAIMELKHAEAEQAQNIMDELVDQDLTIKEFYRLLQEWAGQRLLVDKTPTYSFDLATLQRAEQDFDQPKYIHLLRHPYAMIYSFVEAKLDKNFFRYPHPFSRSELAELIYIISHQNILNFFETIPAERQYRLRFENLLIDPEKELRELCKFLEMEFDGEMLKPYQGNKMTDAVSEHSQMVGDFKFYLRKDIDAGVIDRWKIYHQQDFLSDTAWQIAERFGYAVEKDFATRQGAESHTILTRIERISRSGELPLSFAQQRLWFLEQMESGSAQYNIPGAIRLIGNLNAALMEQSLNQIIERHETLRTVFSTSKEGKACQHILLTLLIKMTAVDMSATPTAVQEAETRKIADMEASSPFDLECGPLLRVNLIKLGNQDHVLIVVMHHIISDGWSMNQFVLELSEIYNSMSEGRSSSLPHLSIQYVDFAAWQRKFLSAVLISEQLDFWKKELEAMPILLELPTDLPRPAVIDYKGLRKVFHVPANLFRDLQNLSQKKDVTLFITLLAAFETLLYRYSNQSDFGVGTPVANRTRNEIEPLIGFFVNTLVLRANLEGNPPFSQLLQHVKQTTLEAFDHQDVPFEKLVDTIQPQRDMSRTPLFQVMFSLQRSNIQTMELKDLSIKPFNLESGTAKFDLSLEMVEYSNRLVGIFEYKTSLFTPQTIERMIGHFETLLEAIVANPNQSISHLPLLKEAERHLLLKNWNSSKIEYPVDQCLHSLIEKQSLLNPQAVAVQFNDQQLTFAELNERAGQLAHFLIEQGVQQEQIVGILMDRSPHLIISMLAIWKAGAAYLPLDPSYPEDRIAFMINDAGVPLVITTQALSGLVGLKSACLCLDTESEKIDVVADKTRLATRMSQCSASNLAYVIYTSGSTGLPKGVLIEHRSALHLMQNLKETIYDRFNGQKLRISLNAPIMFDASVQQIVMLTQGHTLCILPQEVRSDGPALLDYIQKNKIEILDCVPSQLKLLIEAGLLSASGFKPKAILPGGEAIDPALWNQLIECPDIEFFNMYGPTECTVDSTIYRVKDYPARPVIGKPIANAQFFILNDQMQPAPLGVAGELHIGGDGLARGYLNRSQLTTEKFIPNPFIDDWRLTIDDLSVSNSEQQSTINNQHSTINNRLYRTGDLVRWLPDGVIEFLGRVDFQVKVRGFRIELGEIENTLRKHDAIKDAVVLAKSDQNGDKRLVAYCILREGQKAGINDLRDFLKVQLPEYMIPAVFMFMDAFPLTPNGKVDRKALPEPKVERDDLETEFITARNIIEEKLTHIWQQVLGIEKVGIRDNFFELGGDSILSIQVIVRAKTAGIGLTPRQIFEYPTIEGLAAIAGVTAVVVAEQGLVTGEFPLTPVQKHFFEQNYADLHHWNQAVMLEVSTPLEPDILKNIVSKILEQHDALRLRFSKSDSVWLQVNDGLDDAIPFTFNDFSTLPADEDLTAIKDDAYRLQASFNLENGPIIRFAYYRRGEERADRLFIAVHHLAIDGVSWRILTEDIQLAYAQTLAGQKITLPPKSTSYRYWAEQLRLYAQSEALRQEAEFWIELSQKTPPALPVDFENGENDEASTDTIMASLNREETETLLKKTPVVFNTQIMDALITALMMTFNSWTGLSDLMFQLEGHGREDILTNVDVSRTVGWFTSIYPVYLDLTGFNDVLEALRSVKEQLRRIPNNGIGFGLLRYSSNDDSIRDKLASIATPPLVFNYLGQFEQSAHEMNAFKAVFDLRSPERSSKARRSHLLDISASIRNGQLTVGINYSKNLHRSSTIEKLLATYLEELKNLNARCQTAPDSYSPSDFNDVALNNDEIDNLLAEISEE